jgi:hypothetical protein
MVHKQEVLVNLTQPQQLPTEGHMLVGGLSLVVAVALVMVAVMVALVAVRLIPTALAVVLVGTQVLVEMVVITTTTPLVQAVAVVAVHLT